MFIVQRCLLSAWQINLNTGVGKRHKARDAVRRAAKKCERKWNTCLGVLNNVDNIIQRHRKERWKKYSTVTVVVCLFLLIPPPPSKPATDLTNGIIANWIKISSFFMFFACFLPFLLSTAFTASALTCIVYFLNADSFSRRQLSRPNNASLFQSLCRFFFSDLEYIFIHKKPTYHNKGIHK